MTEPPHEPVDTPGDTKRLRDAARRLDSQPGLLSAVDALRRRLPGDEEFGDPLSTAGDEPAAVVGRHMSEKQSERASVLGKLGMGALQVWQALSESTGRGHGDQEVTLLFTDLVGFSSWALDAGDEAALALLRDVGVVVEGAVGDHLGRTVKRLGDGLMAAFGDPVDAVRAALQAQQGLADVEVHGHHPRLRAGVHVGTPRKLGGDYLGVDVNIAARVAEQAGAGEVLASDAVAARLDPVHFSLGRAKKLKADGAPKETRVVTVAARDAAAR